jgi:hypothetical protein
MIKQSRKTTKTNLPDGWKCSIATSVEEIEAIRPIWEKILREEPEPKISANIDRYLSIVEFSKKELQPYVITLFHNDKPKVMVIAWIGNYKVKCKIGYLKIFKPSMHCLSTVYGGVLGQPANEACSVLIQELMNLLKQGSFDLIYFNNLNTDSHIYNLSRKIPGFLSRDHIPVVNLHWQTPIPDDKEQFRKTLSRNEKRNIRRHTKQLEKKASRPVELKSYHRLTDLDEFISIASKISSVTYQKTLTGGFTDSNHVRSLLTQHVKKDRLRAYILYAGSEPIAFEFGLVYNSTYFAAHRGFHPDWSCGSPGSILLLKVLEEFSQDPDIMTYDYGFGDAPYKQRYGKNCWSEASIHIFAPRPYPIFVNTIRTFFIALNNSLKYILRKFGVISNAKRIWRNHLAQKVSEKI